MSVEESGSSSHIPIQQEIGGEYRALASLPSIRKGLLLGVFCFANFLDTFNNSALVAAIPPLAADIGISNSIAVWVLSAYQLTFAALLLISGRLSDLYDPKIVFISGTVPLAFFALGAGFIREQIPLIILRALMGVGASLTIPSALHLIVHMYPDPARQAKAIAFFGASAAFGNVIGLIIGALLVTYASWPWVFYFVTIVALAISLCVFVLVPKVEKPKITVAEKIKRFKRLDLVGVSTLTVALILFIFGITSGSVAGWKTARVIAPLILSAALTAVFFFWEASIPEDMAAIPPKMWFYPNFGILLFTVMTPFIWWGTVLFLFSWLWQAVYGWSTILTAVHFLPVGVLSFPFMVVSASLQQKFPLKYVVVVGQVVTLAGTVLLPFASSPDRYWRFAFPGLVLGTSGATIVFATVNIAIFAVTPPKAAGMVGAIFNCCLQLSTATGIAVITSIQTSVEETHGGPTGYEGRAAGFWFLFAFACTSLVMALVFMRNTLPPVKQKESETDVSMPKEKSPS